MHQCVAQGLCGHLRKTLSEGVVDNSNQQDQAFRTVPEEITYIKK